MGSEMCIRDSASCESLFLFFVLACSSEGVFEFVDSVRFAGVKHSARVWKRDDY